MWLNSGEQIALANMVKVATPPNWICRLFKNDVTLSVTLQASDFTEADFSGYSAQTLTRSSWGSITTDGDGKASITYPKLTFVPDTDVTQSIYGYFITEYGTGTVIRAKKFAEARALTGVDTSLELTITLKLVDADT